MNDTRTQRMVARSWLNRLSSVGRCRDCGRTTITGHGMVGVRSSTLNGRTTAGFAGVATCGRIWLCPVCNAKVMGQRALDLGLVMAWAAAQGYRVIWGALTVRHKRDAALADLLDVQRTAWRSVVQSKTWSSRGPKGTGERIGYVRAAELTDGVNGWHPHFHPVILFDGTRAAASAFASEVEAAWIAGAAKAGAVAKSVAQMLTVLEPGESGDWVHEYVTKSGYSMTRTETTAKLAIETVWSQSKDGRRRAPEDGSQMGGEGAAKTAAHWTLLDAAHDGDKRARARWRELEKATKGHRMLMWSRGLRKMAGISTPDQTDEELAAKVVGTVEDTVCFITSDGWRAVRKRPTLAARILNVVEADGWPALRALLTAEGIGWQTMDEYTSVKYAA